MTLALTSQLKGAIKNLNPERVRRDAERPLDILLVASSSAAHAALEDFFAPASLSHAKRTQIFAMLHRPGDPGARERCDLEIHEEGLPRPYEAFSFSPDRPELMVEDVLYRREELSLALARHFPAFRKPVVSRVINAIARENAVFSAVTALPDVVPSLLELPWAVGEFASDTAFLTANQLRMAFLLAAASDRQVGYAQQKAEIVSIVGGAFGWRALARELAGKVPFGGGIVPKAAIAFAVTYVMGRSLERLYRIGYGLTRAERRLAYGDAVEAGKAIAAAFLERLKPSSGPAA
jgi:hypothetical protein